MLAFPAMLVKPAEEAGIKVPANPDNFDANKFPYFQVYLNVQLGAPLPTWQSHWNNAKIVASVPEDKIRIISYEELIEMGLEIGERLV